MHTGPLGILHLPRLWGKAVIKAIGALPPGYHSGSGPLDVQLAEEIGMDLAASVAYTDAELPTYVAYEEWVRKNATNLKPEPIAEWNERMKTRQKREEMATAGTRRARLERLHRTRWTPAERPFGLAALPPTDYRAPYRRRVRRLVLAVIALLAALAAPPAPVRAQAALVTLKIATTPLDVGAEAFYALAQGFFREAGIDAQVQAIDNGAAVAAGVASGALDIGQSNVVSLATAHEKKLPFVLIAPAARYSDEHPTTELDALNTSPLHTAKDLDGKTSTTNGILNIGQIATMAWIEKNGGDPKSVRFVEMPVASQPAALESGRLDVSLLAEPVLSQTLATGKVHVFSKPYGALGNGWLIGVYFTTESWARAHPDLVRKFADVMAQTARWANAHQAESAKILEQYTKSTLGPQVARAVYAERLDPKSIQPVIDASARYGALTAPFPAAELLFQP